MVKISKLSGFIFLALFSVSVYAQNKEVDIINKETANGVEIYAINKMDDPVEATINVQITGCQRDKGQNPATLLLQPGIETFVSSLIIPAGADCSFRTSVSYKKKAVTREVDGNQVENKRFTSIQMNSNKVNVFTQDGCGRCAMVVKYLEEHKIQYVELNTTIHLPNQDLMFEQLEKAGFKGNSVTMPVIVYDGKTHYNISNLKSFLDKLK
ncbi:MAG: glutaredoxin [Saprospiraceae bacterium]|nr:glutaredoxin [Saprospiraceae bacterium]